MFNFKASGIAAGAAFILSFLVGLISGAGTGTVVLRAFIFAALFFVLVCLVFWAAGQFIPELFSNQEDGLDMASALGNPPGSRVNITVGSEPVEGAFPQDNSEEVDDITQPPPEGGSAFSPASGGLDQDEEGGYNIEGLVLGKAEGGGRPSPRESFSGDEDLIPDFDSLSEAFSPNSGVSSGNVAPEFDAPEDSDVEALVFNSPEPVSTRPARSGASKKKGFEGDFNPKELAQAIQTVLKKDEKG